MRKPDVVRSEVTTVLLESRVVVGGRLPIGPPGPPGRSRIEVSSTAGAVALGHLAAHVDDLAVLGKLPKDPVDAKALKRLNG
ncbi:MAG TPA: hypothetical protein PKB03_06325 [Baekduia sp.]|nr:hypothetical protein [Baekduia sp.]